MCAPAVIPIAAGALVGTAAAVVQGKAAAESARVNALLARRKAGAAKQQGAEQTAQIGAAGRRTASSALAQMAAGGVVTEAPLARTAANVAADQSQARANAALRAWGFEAESEIEETRRKAAKTGIGFGVAGSLLGGAGGITSALTK